MLRRAVILAAALAAVAVAFPGVALADGSVVLSTTFPSVVADKGKLITFPVNVVNRTGDFQQVDLRIADGPTDWKPDLRASGFSVRTVMLEPQKSQSVDFSATPPAAAKAGDYAFTLRAFSGGAVVSELRIAVTLRDVVSSGLKLTTQFPNVRGQSGSTFSFTFDLVNQAGIDRDIGVTAALPTGWTATFRPVGDSKQVSSFRVKAGDTQSINVDITTPSKVDAGEYDVVVAAASGTDKTQAPLKITIAGRTALSLATSSGTLSANATVDQDTKLALVVKNTGSAPLGNITFSSSAPDGWTVKFQPESIAVLGPDQQQDVTATLRPSSRSLAGDYMVALTASGSGTSSDQNIRVTVQTPTAWGLIGLLAIVAVLGGLAWVFTRYSRR